MSAPVKITYTRTWQGKPLVLLDGGPFNGWEKTPAQLRQAAALLLRAADESERQAAMPTPRHWRPTHEVAAA